jgi:hypothetical protein
MNFNPKKDKLVDPTLPHTWDFCGMCGWHIKCGYCGNNCCNGGSGDNCKDNCAEAYVLQNQYYDSDEYTFENP